MARDTIEFVKAALRRPLDVSTIFPTSRALAETMLDLADVPRSESVVELGAGTGAITKHLETRLARPASYVGVELDPKMVDFLRTEFPRLRFESGLAESIGEWVPEGSVDTIISSLPWTMFSPEVQARTIAAITKALKPNGGRFLTYVCANAMLYPQAKTLIKLMRENFRDVHRSDLEWRNIPPAFVFRAMK